ncbi:MAG: hypothetical protein QOE57_2960, partial [Acidimicrobiaceae bacterium]|nr:hypothetical protein [Acidimicrobiaceae bacterium]
KHRGSRSCLTLCVGCWRASSEAGCVPLRIPDGRGQASGGTPPWPPDRAADKWAQRRWGTVPSLPAESIWAWLNLLPLEAPVISSNSRSCRSPVPAGPRSRRLAPDGRVDAHAAPLRLILIPRSPQFRRNQGSGTVSRGQNPNYLARTYALVSVNPCPCPCPCPAPSAGFEPATHGLGNAPDVSR